MQRQLTDRIGRLLTRVAWGVAIFVAFVPALLFLEKEYEEIIEHAEHEAATEAKLVSRLIGSQQEGWVSATDWLDEALREIVPEDWGTRVETLDGKLVHEIAGDERWPLHRDSHPVYNLGKPAGKLTVTGSLHEALIRSLWILFGSCLLAFGFILPFIRRASRALHDASADLEQSEARFIRAVDATADGIWEQDLVSNRLLYVSSNTEKMLGYPAGTFLHPDFRFRQIFSHREDLEVSRQALEEHIRTGRPFACEVRMLHADGSDRWIRLRGAVAKDDEGNPLHMVGSLRDVSEEHEKRLRAECLHNYVTQLLDTLPDAISVKDAQLRFITVNRSFAAMTGRPAEQIVGHSTGDFYPPEVTGPIEEVDRRVLETGKPVVIETTLFNAARRELRINLLQKTPGVGPDGGAIVIGVHHDMTELRRAMARFETIVHDTPMVLAMSFDRGLNVGLWNRAAERLFGLSARQALGRRIRDLLPGSEEGERFAGIIQQVWDTGETFGPQETRLQIAGQEQWLLLTVFPLLEESRVVEVFIMAVDITGRKQIEDELLDHREHLEDMVAAQTSDLLCAKVAAEDANRAKSEFLANMSHELRTPMHAVLSFARIGLFKAATAPTEKIREYFEHIRASGERLLELVNDLLDLSKLEAGHMQYSMGRLDVRRHLDGVVAELATLFESKKLNCKIDVAVADCHVTGDHKRLDQVWRNLLGNAIKFTPEQRSIHVEIAEGIIQAGRRAGDSGEIRALRITVADEGVGIPEAELEAIFDKFTQSSRTTSGAGGTGLGLAICREIVHAHRGTIRARNRPEGGAVFEVLLPLPYESPP